MAAPDRAAGAANLRKAAHFARQALGSEHAVRLSGGRVALFPGRVVETDVATFERRARAALRSGDRAAAEALAAEYPADLLPDLPVRGVDPGAAGAAARLHVALLRLGGQWERLVIGRTRGRAGPPRAHAGGARRGDPHTAIRWYGRLRTNLERQLGPAARRRRPGRCTRSASPVCRRRPAVVGRQPELARLAAALRSAATDGPTVLLVRGGRASASRRCAGSSPSLAEEGGWSRRDGHRRPGPRRLRGAGGGRGPAARPRPHPARPAARRSALGAGRAHGAGRAGRAARAGSPGTW